MSQIQAAAHRRSARGRLVWSAPGLLTGSIALLVLLTVLGGLIISNADRPARHDLRGPLERALQTHTASALLPRFAPDVAYAVAASGAFGTTTASDAVVRVDQYFERAQAPWDFTIPARALDAYKRGPYRPYLEGSTYFGVSFNGYFISVRLNSSGQIDRVFMAASTSLLT